MKQVLIASVGLALLLPASVFAQSAFNGTWVTRMSSIANTGRGITLHVKDGVYECTSCPTPQTIKTDGEDHAVKGEPGIDTTAITIVDPSTIRIVDKRKGKVVDETTLTAAPDGKTATYEFTDSSGTSPVTGKAQVDRAAKGAPGSNAMAGTWKFGHWIDLSANARTFTYKVDGRSISYSDPTGKSYTAEIGGKAVVGVNPSHPGQAVAVAQLAPNELRETFSRDGKVVGTSTMTVAADGKTMKSVDRNLRMGRASTSIADQQ